MDSHFSQATLAEACMLPQQESWPLSDYPTANERRMQPRSSTGSGTVIDAEGIVPSRAPTLIEAAADANAYVSFPSVPDEDPIPDEERPLEQAISPDRADADGNSPDPDPVDWEGDSDLRNPRNWVVETKATQIVFILAMCVTHAFPITSLIPAIQDIQRNAGSSDVYLPAFVGSAYLLGYIAGPLCIVPLFEVFGRVPLYRFCNLLCVIFSCWCAVAKNLGTLALLRLLAGCGGAVTATLAPGSVSDLFGGRSHPLLFIVVQTVLYVTPAISPLLGGYIYFKWGQQWVFWSSAIAGSICLLFSLLLPETYKPALLRRKHEITGWSISFQDRRESMDTDRCYITFRQTLRILVSPYFIFTSYTTATGVALLHIVYIILPATFLPEHTWPSKNGGLPFLGIAAGILIAGAYGGLATSTYPRKMRRMRNEAGTGIRLIPMLCLWPLVCMGLFLYGHLAHKETHQVGSIVSLGVFGAGIMSAILLNGFHLNGVFPDEPTPVAGASLLMQSLFGGIVPLCSFKLYERVSIPHSFYVLGLVSLVVGISPGIFYLVRRAEG